MIMKLPIQERKAIIHKHNIEQNAINEQINGQKSSNERRYEGETINAFAKIEQNKRENGRL